MTRGYKYRTLCGAVLAVSFISCGLCGEARCRDLTLSEAIDMAVNRSSRGDIIEGDLEVAEQNYSAERINFYIPEISINGQVPVYNVTESFRFFGGLDEKQLIRTTDRDFRTYIELKQSLLTGGDLTMTGNLWNRKSEYPQFGIDVIEKTNQGVFDFTFQQPILKPSDTKNKLNNTKDDLEIARYARAQEVGNLKKEVIEAYFGVLETQLLFEITSDKMESARLQSEIDSAKYADGILAEDAWLESKAARLDAELELFDVENQQVEKNRELALLLDIDITEQITPSIPPAWDELTEGQKNGLISAWEISVPIKKAEFEYSKAKRLADYTASSHGLTGIFEANYSLGRGDVDVDGTVTENNTDSWSMALNFTLPLWDGGSTGAAIKAARITAQKSELEYERARKSARAQIVALLHRIDVSYRKQQVMQEQVEIAKSKLDIAKYRYDDGQISRIDYLTNKVSYLEARTGYLTELKTYLTNRIEIESMYIS